MTRSLQLQGPRARQLAYAGKGAVHTTARRGFGPFSAAAGPGNRAASRRVARVGSCRTREGAALGCAPRVVGRDAVEERGVGLEPG